MQEERNCSELISYSINIHESLSGEQSSMNSSERTDGAS
jgi:hypothetical protein